MADEISEPRHGLLLGRGVAGLVLLALIALYFGVPSLVIHLTATEVHGNVALWLYDTDAAPGDHLDATVRVNAPVRPAVIIVVSVTGPGRHDLKRVRGNRDDALDFTIDVPKAAGDEIEVTIDAVYAYSDGLQSNESFFASIPVYGNTESLLRRGGKALLAIASLVALIGVDVVRRRWYARRSRRPGRIWLFGLLPVVAVGWLWFAALLEQALRLHGWWFVVGAVAVWLLALAVAERLTRYSGTTAYAVEQAMIESMQSEPFRGASVRVPVQPVSDLELAWFGAGFSVDRVHDALRVALPGRGVVIVDGTLIEAQVVHVIQSCDDSTRCPCSAASSRDTPRTLSSSRGSRVEPTHRLRRRVRRFPAVIETVLVSTSHPGFISLRDRRLRLVVDAQHPKRVGLALVEDAHRRHGPAAHDLARRKSLLRSLEVDSGIQLRQRSPPPLAVRSGSSPTEDRPDCLPDLIDGAAFACTQRSESFGQTLFLIGRQRRSVVDGFYHRPATLVRSDPGVLVKSDPVEIGRCIERNFLAGRKFTDFADANRQARDCAAASRPAPMSCSSSSVPRCAGSPSGARRSTFSISASSILRATSTSMVTSTRFRTS